MKRAIVTGLVAVLAVCGCQVKEINEITNETKNEPEAKVFTAIIEDNNPETKTSLDNEGNVLWKQGDQVSIFAGSTINEQYQVTAASDGKTAASLNRVTSPGFVAGTDINNNVAYYPYTATAGIAKSGSSYVISDIMLPAAQTYAESSFGNGAFPMTAVTGSADDYNLKFKNVLGGLKLQLKGTARIASISIRGNNNEVLCGAAEVTVANWAVPSISMKDASAKTVTLDCGNGVQLNAETTTAFIIALPAMTMEGGFTVTVADTDGGQMEIKSTKSQTITRSNLLKMPAVDYNPDPVTGTVAEARAVAEGTPVIIEEAIVAAKSKAGLVVADGTGNVYIYFDSKANETVPAVTIGDKVKVEATKSTYGGVPEFKTPTVTKLSSGTMTYPEPKDLNPVAASYASNTTEFVQMTGTLKIDGPYTNIEINGVDSNTKIGSVSQPTDNLNVSSFDGKTVTVKGYFISLTGSNKYINVVATEIALADPNVKFCNVSPASIKAKADDTSASFKISSNADWTITCDNDAFTVSPASSSGDATISISFPANETDSPKEANFRVFCADAGVETMVALTQAKTHAVEVFADFRNVVSELPQNSAEGLQDKTVTLAGMIFTIHAADKFYQTKTGDTYYLFIGKINSYIQLPAIDGKALVKVEFTTGPIASENVIIDVAKTDGTRLNINTEKNKSATKYEWDVPGETGVAYRLVVTNSYNAHFQYLTLTYE